MERGKPRMLSLPERPTGLAKSDVLVFVVGAALIIGFVFFVAERDYNTTIELWRSRLSAEVLYRTWTLRSSLQQSEDDTRVLADSPYVKDFLLAPRGVKLAAQLAAQMRALDAIGEFRRVYEYLGVYLLDHSGRIILQQTGPPASAGHVTEELPKLFSSFAGSRQYSVNLVGKSLQELHLVFMMPIFDTGSTASPKSALAIVDPFSREILPLLRARTFTTRTGQTLFVQFGNGKARYVSQRDEPSVSPHREDTLLGSAPSAVEDHASFGQFVDDRGADVMAAMQSIPNLNSVIVFKVDKSEALADVYRTISLEIATAIAALVALAGIILVHRRSSVAREMRFNLDREQYLNEELEALVSERTAQLAQINQQLHIELGERRKAEQDVRNLNVELEFRVSERTTQLQAAVKELESFSYSVAHDLRAPLRSINGFSRILLDTHLEYLPSEAQHFLKMVGKSAVEMGQLIEALLSFSRLNRQPPVKTVVDPTELVQELWGELIAGQLARKVELTIGDIPKCQADPLLLKQVFINLLSNALKYTRKRDIAKIEVGYNASGAYYVRDNGVGFDMKFQDKLFGVFQRLHSVEEYEGTGIGLATVQRIIQRHGGTVWAEAAIDKGATFYFTLPADKALIAGAR